MSHFTCIHTQIKQIDPLVKALNDLGFAAIEVHDIPQSLYGFEDDRRMERAEVIIRRQFLGPMSNDIGFQRQADGTFTAIISEYDRLQYSEQWLSQVAQRYAYHVLMASADLEGFTVESDTTLSDGTLRIVMGRWV